MLDVTTEYSNAIIAPVRKVEARVTWGFIDTEARDNASIEVTSEHFISKTDQVLNEVAGASVNIATNENNGWLLDGTYQLYLENNDWEIGWWSDNLSSSEGVIDETLTFDLLETADIVGFTLTFGENGIACDFNVKYYLDDELIKTIEVTDNIEKIYVSNVGVENFNRLSLNFTKIKPRTRVRVLEFLFGIIITYSGEEIVSIKSEEVINILADNLSDGGIDIEVENIDKTLNIVNPSGIIEYLQQEQEFKVELGIEGEYLILGTQMLYEWLTTSDFKASFYLRSQISFISGTYEPVSYDLASATTLLGEIFASQGISDYYIDESLDDVILNRYRSSCDNRKAIADIVNASCAVLKVDRLGKICIIPFSEVLQDKLIDFDNADFPEITQVSRVNKFTTSYFSYDESGLSEESQVEVECFSSRVEVVENKSNPFLATLEQATAMLNYYKIWKNYRLYYEQTWRGDMAVEAGDIVEVENGFNTDNVCVTEIDINYDGTLSANYIGYGGVGNE